MYDLFKMKGLGIGKQKYSQSLPRNVAYCKFLNDTRYALHRRGLKGEH